MSIERINPKDPLSQSKNLIHDNIETLKTLFPQVVTEAKIDFNVLEEILGEELEKEDEYYRFTWAGKTQARREAHKPSAGTLRPAREESLDWETTQNLYLEGDNLEVLKLLQKSYGGRVKMIYIDPPYNTGEDFVYRDNYRDNIRNYHELTGQLDSEGNRLTINSDSDGRYHSNWLNMMYPRLILARNLLRDDGVIFISIDDNEVENLIKLGNEIFGESNYIGAMVWKKTENIKMDSKFFSVNKDYVIVFRKKSLQGFGKRKSDLERFKLKDDKGRYYLRKLDSKSSSYSKSMDYVIEHQGVKYYAGGDYNKYIQRQKYGGNKKDSIWLWSESKFKEGLLNNDIVFKNNNVYNKVRYDGKAKKPYTDFIDAPSGQTSQRELNDLFGGSRVFDSPKPYQLIDLLLNLGELDENEIIIDFFSGSASTHHSVLHRCINRNVRCRVISIQLPEPVSEKSEAFKSGYSSIAEIGRDRIYRVVQKIKEEHPTKSKKMDLGFKVFKLDSSNIKSWDGSPESLESNLYDAIDNIKIDRTEEDVLYEILLKYGLDLTLPVEERLIAGKKVYKIYGGGGQNACFSA